MGIVFFDKEKSYNVDYNIQKNYDGFYIAGITDDDYLSIFKTSKYTHIYSPKTNNFIDFDEIFFYDNKKTSIFSNNITVELFLDNNYIVFGKDYDNNNCFENSTGKNMKDYII